MEGKAFVCARYHCNRFGRSSDDVPPLRSEMWDTRYSISWNGSYCFRVIHFAFSPQWKAVALRE